MLEPLVTIGVPVFNGENSILSALNSIMDQSYKNLEIIVSDNCSTDSTGFILENFAKDNPKVRVIRQVENIGLTNNFNFLASQANGKYFMWAAHDDTRDPTYVAKCVSKLEESDSYGLCAPRAKVKSGNNENYTWQSRLPKDLRSTSEIKRFKSTVREFPAVAMYGVYRTSLIKKTNLLPNIVGSDLLFIQELALICSFIEIEEYLFFYSEREKWNSKKQDFQVFFGSKKPSLFYSPIILVTGYQFRIVLNSKLKVLSKLRLFIFVCCNLLSQVTIKIAILILRRIYPASIRNMIMCRFYWVFMHPKSVECLDEPLFVKRIIKPRFGIKP
jgi:glycosyltransferase involved in cell wall biosynthesis